MKKKISQGASDRKRDLNIPKKKADVLSKKMLSV